MSVSPLVPPIRDIEAAADFRIERAHSGEFFFSIRSSIGAAGDLNGDGLADLVLGASDSDPDGKLFAGVTYVIFGRASLDFAATITGTDGADVLTPAGVTAAVVGGRPGASAEFIETGAGADRVAAGGGDDTVLGEDGRDVLRGNLGDDRLFGGLEADRLFGGFGGDTLTGGAGDDVFRYTSTFASNRFQGDVILDFEGPGAAVGDLIDLSVIDANALVVGDQAFTLGGDDVGRSASATRAATRSSLRQHHRRRGPRVRPHAPGRCRARRRL